MASSQVICDTIGGGEADQKDHQVNQGKENWKKIIHLDFVEFHKEIDAKKSLFYEHILHLCDDEKTNENTFSEFGKTESMIKKKFLKAITDILDPNCFHDMANDDNGAVIRKQSDFYCFGCKAFQKNKDLFEFGNCGCRACRNCTYQYITGQMQSHRCPMICFVCNIKQINPSDIQIFGFDYFDMGLYRKYVHRSKRMRK